MKQCPRCGKNYTDENLNFCLDDGELLSNMGRGAESRGYADDSPPTVMLDEARRTNPTNWPSSPPSTPPAQWQPSPNPPPFAAAYPFTPTPSQTMAAVSLGLGIGSLTIGWCCSLGLLLAPASLIVGFIALTQIKKDPAKYAGRGLAIGGIVTSFIFITLYVLFLIIWGFSVFLGGLR